MGKFLIWPVAVILFWIFRDVYHQFRPCNPGLFVAACGVDDYLFKSMLVESIVVYVFSVLRMVRVWKRIKHRTATVYEYVFIGVMSTAIVHGGTILYSLTESIAIGPYELRGMWFPFIVIGFPFVALPAVAGMWWEQLLH